MKRKILKKNIKGIIIISLFIFLLITSLFIGASKEVTLSNLLAGNKNSWLIFINSRLSRTIAIILSSSGLAVAGTIMQAISRNKFMSPTTSGTNSACALGIIVSFILFQSKSGLFQMGFAFFFALVCTFIFSTVISKLKIKEITYIPLLGMMYGGILAAITSALAYMFNAMQMMSSLGLGSFSRIGNFEVIYAIIVPLVISLIYSKKFSIIGIGEDFSKNLGINYNMVVFLGLVIVSLISASTFVAVGPLPFVGLVIPNLIKAIYGDNIKKSIVDMMVFSSVFVLLCDILSRLVIYPFEMSVSLTISVVGGIVFIIYILGGLKYGTQKNT